MATQQQQLTQMRYIDLPELGETFSDSIHNMTWDGQTLRVEFCVTRYPVADAAEPEGKRYPSCRLVLTPGAALDLFGRLQQTMNALAKAGVLTQKNPPQTTPTSTAPAGTA